MTPPEAPEDGTAPPAVSVWGLELEALRKRADFLACARAAAGARRAFWCRRAPRAATTPGRHPRRLHLLRRRSAMPWPATAPSGACARSPAWCCRRRAPRLGLRADRPAGDGRAPLGAAADLRRSAAARAAHDAAGPYLALPVRAYRLVFSPGSASTAAISRPAGLRARGAGKTRRDRGLAGGDRAATPGGRHRHRQLRDTRSADSQCLNVMAGMCPAQEGG